MNLISQMKYSMYLIFVFIQSSPNSRYSKALMSSILHVANVMMQSYSIKLNINREKNKIAQLK